MCLRLKGLALEMTERGFYTMVFWSNLLYTESFGHLLQKGKDLPPREHLRDAETPQAREFVNTTEESATMMALPAW